MTKSKIATGLLFALLAAPALSQQQGYLGIRVEKLANPKECMRVEALFPGGSAERAGLQVGDVVTKINGAPVDCSPAAAAARPLPQMAVGEKLTFSLLRSGQTFELSVPAEPPPAGMSQAQEQALERESKMEAGEAMRQRLIRNREPFTIVMGEDGEYHYEGNFSAEEAALLHWYDYELMLGPQMHKGFKPGRHDIYLTFDRARNAFQVEPAPPQPPKNSRPQESPGDPKSGSTQEPAASRPGMGTPSKPAPDRETRYHAGMDLRDRISEAKIRFVIIMAENGEYRYEGDLTPEEAALLHWLDHETMAGPQMHKLFKAGRHELYMMFDKARNTYNYENAAKSEAQ